MTSNRATIALMRLLSFALVLFLTACANPAGPSKLRPDAFVAPDALAPVMAALDADGWRHPLLNASLGAWVRANVARIDAVSMPANIGARAHLQERRLEWNPNAADMSIPWQASLLLHEARHLEKHTGHSCGPHDLAGDQTIEEGGAYAVQILYLEHVGAMAEAAYLRANFIGCK